MKTMNCLLAGLPDTGKSTYIGGLWYNLKNYPKNGNESEPGFS